MHTRGELGYELLLPRALHRVRTPPRPDLRNSAPRVTVMPELKERASRHQSRAPDAARAVGLRNRLRLVDTV